MSTSIQKYLDSAYEDLTSNSVNVAIESLSELDAVCEGRHEVEECIETIAMSDGDVVDTLLAEDRYKTWRSNNMHLVDGNAQTGTELMSEMVSTMESLATVSMESDPFRAMTKAFNSIKNLIKTGGKDIAELKSRVNAGKEEIEKKPVVITGKSLYRFLMRAGKPVKLEGNLLAPDLKFIDACNKHYHDVVEKATELAKQVRDASQSDSSDTIRDTIDYLNNNLLDRNALDSLTKFSLLGSKEIAIDRRGFPKFREDKGTVSPGKVDGKGENNLFNQLAQKKVHGFVIGGPLKSVKGVEGMNFIKATQAVNAQVKATGGIVPANDLIKLLDQAMGLNQKAGKFASMASVMNDKLAHLSNDMDRAYDNVNSEKSIKENAARMQDLRSLHKAATRSVAHHIFVARALAMVLEDHATYMYHRVTELASQVLAAVEKREKKETQK